MEKQSTFSEGDKVRLGDSREGIVVGKRERVGFHGYIVKITKSVDENQVGQTVAATATTMKKLSQTMPGIVLPTDVSTENPYVAPPVEEVAPTSDQEKENEIRKKELNYTQKQIQMLQTKLNDLQQLVAQNVTTKQNQPGSDSMEELDRIDQADEQNVQQHQETDLAQQQMQQEKQLQDQKMRQEQQIQNQQLQMMQRSSSRWIHPERANIKIAVKNIDLICDVAATPRQQASGLQPYDFLHENRGLWFPFTNRRTASFHMGEVSFPIDIIFVDSGKINKIVADVQPRQMGSWKSLCTDVIEVNGGWCRKNNIRVGDSINTPLSGRPRTAGANSYDTLRTITTAEEEDTFEQDMLNTFPFLKEAQEHRQPDTTDKRSPGTFDGRNPQVRFLHNTLPDSENPFGDGDPGSTDPFDAGSSGNPPSKTQFVNSYGRNFDYQRGWWPSPKDEEEREGVPIRPAQRVTVENADDVDMTKLANSSVTLYDRYGPDWHDYDHGEEYEGDPGYAKMAIINDELISNWIDTLGFDSKDEEKLRKTMFTDDYKVLLGDTLVTAGKISDYEIFDSDLLLYQ